ncbi:peptidoglycan-associated lipoprotein Pal [Hydrocarboniclastica marina]|uniref:Peptidoglycan-associated lipoprotein n=1 Tax=Hydrocarboniclastica marina TaxID=2259620 RepID=A0A4P7XFT0_9ALTE|nr:peptidoglycan-associated lipoprotein Pal [Hydrocarboniclastica marina]MAL98419.1 peptidoglycan-associated lipoprotein [Alteromonadaceae bacterium]QCF25821.1 peptidoglycan-associated lipoprotein Pal [Hydrocarboniclastica marina]|tara:strand:+ start:2220 stop:2786 length:567 start_codon:yes stop_codon:yes gene_type:complete
MINYAKQKAVILALSMAFVAGCSSTGSDQDFGMPGDAQPVDQDGGSEVYGGGSGSGVSGSDLADERAAAEQSRQQDMALRDVRTIYFDFDSAEIRAESRDVLMAHARYLANNSSTDVVLKGHTDERGTTEYNLALGERRAQAVERYLAVNGVSRDRIETVSYGEERPAVSGSGEEAYAKNRRVELEYE